MCKIRVTNQNIHFFSFSSPQYSLIVSANWYCAQTYCVHLACEAFVSWGPLISININKLNSEVEQNYAVSCCCAVKDTLKNFTGIIVTFTLNSSCYINIQSHDLMWRPYDYQSSEF